MVRLVLANKSTNKVFVKASARPIHSLKKLLILDCEIDDILEGQRISSAMKYAKYGVFYPCWASN